MTPVAALRRGLLLVAGLVTTTLATGAHAAGPSGTGFVCRANGFERIQMEPCPPGTELRRGQVVNGLMQRSAPPAALPNLMHLPLDAPNTDAASRPGSDPVEAHMERHRRGQEAAMKMTVVAMAAGAVAKALGRSFWLWFVLVVVGWTVAGELYLMGGRR